MNENNCSVNNLLATKTVNKTNYSGQALSDVVAIEEPLQITLLWQDQAEVFTITMRTPGHDRDLALGLLFSERQIASIDDIAEIRYEHNQHGVMNNHLEVRYQPGKAPDLSDLQRRLISQSSCGVCGKTSLKSLSLSASNNISSKPGWLEKALVCALPDKLKHAQPLFAATGATHGAGLFDQNYNLIACFEDVGRHNALDKLIGATLTNPLANHEVILVVSGRVSFELVQKAIVAGYPVIIAVGAPSSLAIAAAKQFDLTLAGFTRANQLNIYCGVWRFSADKESSLCLKT